jgi:hypothetical protein
MRNALLCAVALLLSMTSALPAQEEQEIKKGALVYASAFNDEADRAKWSKAPFASWVQEGANGSTVLKASVAQDEKAGTHMVRLPIDLKPWRGAKIWLSCQAKAKDVSQAPQAWNGVKFMLHYKTPSREFHGNQSSVYGSFDWKELSFSAFVDPDIESAELYLGLQESCGEVLFDSLKIVVAQAPLAARPAPLANPPPAYKGHELPRLRGAMSPRVFKDEEFKLFGADWNANIVRWQMTRKWGQANTDLDLEEYDRWLAGECEQIDQLLAAARKYGYLVVLDLHSPPGGRYEDKSMRMFYERKYNDHFVKVWERFAERYKGHPAIWGYDLVNEPCEGKPPLEGMDYLSTQTRAAKAIRAIDPKTAIIIEAADWDSPRGFNELQPVPVSDVVYQVHMYEPGQFTHQGVHSNPLGVVYPGKIGGVQYDKEKLRAILKPVRDFQLAYSVHIYVGEFSAARWAPGASQYLSDCIDIFEGYGWDWSYHAFREWDGWSLEHGSDTADRKPSATPTDRLQLLQSWYKKNLKPAL